MASCALAGALVLLAAACGGGSSSSERHTFKARGGTGTNGAGGAAGGAYIDAAGAQITVKKSGGLPTLPTWSYAAPELGSNPLTISSDTELTVDATVTGDDGTSPATGLWIKKGATLTVTPAAGAQSIIHLSDGIRIDGTLAAAKLTGTLSSSSIELSGSDLAVTGRILATGGDAAAGSAGGDGGEVEASLSDNVFVTGSILTTGGRGDTGGSGGDIDLEVAGPAYATDATRTTIAVTGLLDSSGGEGLAGIGGGAGYLSAWGSWDEGGFCDFFNSGVMRANGGAGTTGGGEGAWVYASPCLVGEAVNRGTIESSGGAATVDGAGGAGDGVQLETDWGVVYAGGKLVATGGKGAGTGGGGDGGDVELFAVGPNRGFGTVTGVPIGLRVAASRIDASGGDGASGGNGGDIYVEDEGAAADDLGITVSGFSTLDLGGGAGTAGGGGGGDVEIYPYERYDSAEDANVLGPLTCEAGIDVRGGAASAGAGGSGGYAWVGTWIYERGPTLLNPETVQTVSTGKILASGGQGTTNGGGGGEVYVYDEVALSSRGVVDVSGGAGGSDVGGQGGYAEIYGPSGAAITVTGAVLASGGASASAAGGAGGAVYSYGDTVSLGAVTADGGAAPTATGGNGGTVTLTSDTPPSTVTGTISLRGGAGATAGTVGTFTMDGSPMSLTDGRYTP